MSVIAEHDDTRITRAIVGALREHDLSGFELWQWLGPVHGTSGTLTEATIYPTLLRLEEQCWIEGAWHEGERTRRKYRITATGLRRAEAEGWGPVAFGRFRGTGASPAHGSGGDDGEWVWPAEATPLPGDAALPTGSPEAVAVDAFLDAFQRKLRLSPVYCSDVRHEIADHIADASARLRTSLTTSADVVTEVLEALGPPDTLAERINVSQLTEDRLRRGMSWAGAFAVLTGLIGFALTWAALMIGTPFLVSFILGISKDVGVHLYVPVSGEWSAETFALGLCSGAFVGARRSMPFLALHSRRADFDVWRLWSVAGGLPLAAVALLMPVTLDPLTGGILLGLPLAWVIGTRHPAPLYGDTLTGRGVALGAAVVLVLLLLPGGRIWYYDPGVEPAADPTAVYDTRTYLVWDSPAGSPMQKVTVSDLPDGWHDARVEFWPAGRIGPMIVPDAAAQRPTLAVDSGAAVNLDALSRDQADWWATVTATGPDGGVHVVHAEVVFGDPSPTHSGILLWLISLF